MRIFWCFSLSIYTLFFLNLLLALYNENWVDYSFLKYGLVMGGFTAVCSYLSSILMEIRIKELPNLAAKKLQRECNKNKRKVQIKWIKVLGYTSIIIGFIISANWYMAYDYRVIYILLILISASIETWLKFFRKQT